jgi:hypothetical protein
MHSSQQKKKKGGETQNENLENLIKHIEKYIKKIGNVLIIYS